MYKKQTNDAVIKARERGGESFVCACVYVSECVVQGKQESEITSTKQERTAQNATMKKGTHMQSQIKEAKHTKKNAKSAHLL